VERTKNVASIPSWIGEEIPVPFEVAQEVGRLRKRDERLVRLIEKVVPDDKVVTIESDGVNVIINCCFGTLVNESLSRYLSAFLTVEYGESVETSVDPCRIIIKLPRKIVNVDKRIKEILMEADNVRKGIEPILYNSYYFRYILFHVAKKFGAIRKDANFREVGSRALMAFKDTSVYKEGVRELFEDRLDVTRCEALLERMRNNEIKISFSPISHIGRIGIGKGEIISPGRAEHQILEVLKKRLEDRKIMLYCLNCKKYIQITKVKRITNTKCPMCKSVRVTVLRPWERSKIALAKKKELSKEEEKELEDMYKVSNLFSSYGKSLAMAIVATGVGSKTAMRIMRMTRRGDEEMLLKNILEAELTYARTKEFWD
jgi:Lhr-like helicases